MPALNPIVRYGRYGALAFEFSGTIAGGVAVGWLIDRGLDSAPWGVVTCMLLAVVGGFVRLVTILRRFERRELDADT